MEFKHYAFMTVLICSVWALTVSGLSSVDQLGSIEFKSELNQISDEETTTNFSEAPIGDGFNAIVKVLNLALPLALGAIVMLLLTYGSNPIGLGSLCVAIVLFGFASTKAMDAADVINASTQSSLDARVWWF